ncbi:MAG: hypothetical protein WAN48_09310 [Actinomycetes bacterium]
MTDLLPPRRTWVSCDDGVMSGSSRTTQAGASGGGAVYGLGLIGAAVFYWQHADGLWGHLWALVEAVLWPAFVVYDLLAHLS